MTKFLIVVVCFTCLFGSCRSTKNIQTAIAKKDSVAATSGDTNDLRSDSIAFMQQQYRIMQEGRINYTTFSAKLDVDYRDVDGKKYDVNAHLRMYKDSVIWVSVTAILGIEGLRAYITKDSVKLLDKQNKTYVARSVSYLQEVTALPLDLSSLQDLLIGNPVFLDSNIVSYNKATNTISLLAIGDFFRNLVTISENEKQLQSSKLDDLDGVRNRTCYITYSDYETKKGVPFAAKRSINVSEKNKLDIRLDFKQYDFNETLTFPFSIPKNYKRN